MDQHISHKTVRMKSNRWPMNTCKYRYFLLNLVKSSDASTFCFNVSIYSTKLLHCLYLNWACTYTVFRYWSRYFLLLFLPLRSGSASSMQIQIQEVSHNGDLCGSGSNKNCIPVFVSVADSEPFDADPDPSFQNDADPDPTLFLPVLLHLFKTR